MTNDQVVFDNIKSLGICCDSCVNYIKPKQNVLTHNTENNERKIQNINRRGRSKTNYIF